MRRLLSVFLFATFLSDVKAQNNSSAQPVDPLRETWAEAACFLINDAHRSFESKGASLTGTAQREGRFGEAITLINATPRTDGHVKQARTILESLIGESSNDRVDCFSRFFLARILEVDIRPAEPETARKLFREVLEKYPGDVLAENGAAQLVLLDLYDNIPNEERQRRFEALELLATRLRTASGQRDFEQNLANAYLDFHGDPKHALRHFIAADHAGITHDQTEANTWISIGELAAQTKDFETARKYYSQFLAKYHEDNRHFTIEQHLHALPPAG